MAYLSYCDPRRCTESQPVGCCQLVKPINQAQANVQQQIALRVASFSAIMDAYDPRSNQSQSFCRRARKDGLALCWGF